MSDRGKGSEVWDIDGDRFIDFTAGVAVLAAGHAHPASWRRSRTRPRSISTWPAPTSIAGRRELAETPGPHHPRRLREAGLLHQLGHRIDRSRDEAVPPPHRAGPCFIQLPGRVPRAHLRLHVARHAASTLHRTGYQPLLAGIYHAPYPNPYRPPFDVPPEKPGPRLRRLHREDDVAATWCAPSEVAGIFVEPIQGEGGYVVPPDDFYPALRDLCDRYDIPLVVDEVQSGMGRTGKMFAIEHWGVEPDVSASPRASRRAAAGRDRGAARA